MKVTAAAALAMVVFPTTTVLGIDNGIGVTPPRGWRSWNQFQCAINQTMIEAQYEAMVDRSRQVNGKNMSLVDVGYLTVSDWSRVCLILQLAVWLVSVSSQPCHFGSESWYHVCVIDRLASMIVGSNATVALVVWDSTMRLAIRT